MGRPRRPLGMEREQVVVLVAIVLSDNRVLEAQHEAAVSLVTVVKVPCAVGWHMANEVRLHAAAARALETRLEPVLCVRGQQAVESVVPGEAGKQIRGRAGWDP